MRLGHALLGEVYVLVAREAVQLVPLALAMAHEHEHVRHGSEGCLPGFMSLTARSRPRFRAHFGRVKGKGRAFEWSRFWAIFLLRGHRFRRTQQLFPGDRSRFKVQARRPWSRAPDPVAAPKCRSHCPAGENAPVGRDMGKLDTLAWSGKDHFVLADDVAAAERGKSDIAVVPWADIALRVHTPLSLSEIPRASAAALPRRSEVPDGASRLWR